MNKTIIIPTVLLLCAVCSFAQSTKRTSLIASNCDAGETICSTQHVFRYDFVNGEFIGKEKILAIKTDDVRFDLGANRIYRNRFLVTDWGDVVDLSTRKVVHQSKGELVEIDGDHVVIKLNRTDQEGIFTYNLQTGKYEQLKSPNVYEIKGELSPDKKYVASKDYSKGLIFKEVKTGKEKVVKGSFGVGLSSEASEFGKLPILWLDNSRVLTQNSNGDLRIVHINGKVERVLQIDLKNEPYKSPELYRNANGEIIYSCYDSFIIDLENKKSRKYESFAIGEGFHFKADESVKNDWGTGSVFYFNDAEIGRIWSGSRSASNGFLAVIYGKEGTNLGSPDGVKVWSNINRNWTTLEIKWSPRIIGWITE